MLICSVFASRQKRKTAAVEFSKEKKEVDRKLIKHNNYSNNFYWNKVIAEHLLYFTFTFIFIFFLKIYYGFPM